MCGIAPDGTRVTPKPAEPSESTAATAEECSRVDITTADIAAPLSALSLESTDSFRTRSNSRSSETSDSDSESESKGPITPKTTTSEPLDVEKVDEGVIVDTEVERTREILA